MTLKTVAWIIILSTLTFVVFPPKFVQASNDTNATESDIGKGALLKRLFLIGHPSGTAESSGVTTVETERALQSNPIIVAGRIVRGALALVGLIFFTLMIYGGSLYLTAGGNEEQVKKAVHVLARAAIGGLIVIFAGAITQFLTGQLRRPVAPTPASGVTEACPRGPSYSTTILNGCREPGYTYNQFPSPTCQCGR